MHKRREVNQFHLRQGEVEFRLLCNTYAAGGLIGRSGNIIQGLERQTSSKISVAVAAPAAKFRLIHVVAASSLTRTIVIGGREVRLSPAQEALIRVFERMLESEAEAKAELKAEAEEAVVGGGVGKEFVRCSLVVGPGMVGAVIGKGGERINKVIKQTRAYIKILPLESPVPGTDPYDELVQITGRSISVKNALVDVSLYLQQKAIEADRGAPKATSSWVDSPSMKMDTNFSLMNDTTNAGDRAKVVFKLICPYQAAGFVIGTKGAKVKALEEETKACIRFSEAGIDYHERVVTVYAFENREVQYSFAQNAIVRVFNELVLSKEKDTVTARLLILPHQSDWLNDGEISTISAINEASSATLKILELDNLPVGACANEKVLQIDGDYPNVQIALFQVTWRLRERFFDASLPKDNLPVLPHTLLNLPSQGNKVCSALTDKMNNCRVSKEINVSVPSMFPHLQFSSGSCLNRKTASSGGLGTTSGGSNFASGNKSAMVTSTKLEISVREDVFGNVYGENDSNLTRLRLISGATVVVQDPGSGGDGKVIISGTPDQTLVAQSLLQAFLMSPQ